MDVSTLEVNVAVKALRRTRLFSECALVIRCLLERMRASTSIFGVCCLEKDNRLT